MFDFSFGEMLVVALVALVVLGPERLPKAARFAGLWVRKARAQWYSMKNELEQELASEELRRSLADARTTLEESHASTLAAVSTASDALEDAASPAVPPAGTSPPVVVSEAGDRRDDRG
ncbi:MAG: twin-arginine translocase subunit TatB [Thermomonas sp.]|nr:twin-arginine translocase subunit TatB [Thermomonas sp.]